MFFCATFFVSAFLRPSAIETGAETPCMVIIAPPGISFLTGLAKDELANSTDDPVLCPAPDEKLVLYWE
jgi:hypothetical protein|tara:strand:- start:7713 stop:7919 length:207 start_codon:yes stop_codon:yes gene_type:complete